MELHASETSSLGRTLNATLEATNMQQREESAWQRQAAERHEEELRRLQGLHARQTAAAAEQRARRCAEGERLSELLREAREEAAAVGSQLGPMDQAAVKVAALRSTMKRQSEQSGRELATLKTELCIMRQEHAEEVGRLREHGPNLTTELECARTEVTEEDDAADRYHSSAEASESDSREAALLERRLALLRGEQEAQRRMHQTILTEEARRSWLEAQHQQRLERFKQDLAERDALRAAAYRERIKEKCEAAEDAARAHSVKLSQVRADTPKTEKKYAQLRRALLGEKEAAESAHGEILKQQAEHKREIMRFSETLTDPRQLGDVLQEIRNPAGGALRRHSC